jgi:hypothetical protein
LTPLEVADAARREYNVASGDTFFSDTQLYEWLYAAEIELCKKTMIAKQVYSTTTVAGTAEYNYPTNAFAIKNVTYNGYPLRRITFREDDLLSGGDQDSTTQGEPIGYVDWGQVLYLRPLPNAARTLKMWSYIHPSAVHTATSSFVIPDEFHIQLKEYCLARMCAKNKNYEGYRFYQGLWDNVIAEATEYVRLKERGDNFNIVQNVDMAETLSIAGWLP